MGKSASIARALKRRFVHFVFGLLLLPLFFVSNDYSTILSWGCFFDATHISSSSSRRSGTKKDSWYLEDVETQTRYENLFLLSSSSWWCTNNIHAKTAAEVGPNERGWDFFAHASDPRKPATTYLDKIMTDVSRQPRSSIQQQ